MKAPSWATPSIYQVNEKPSKPVTREPSADQAFALAAKLDSLDKFSELVTTL